MNDGNNNNSMKRRTRTSSRESRSPILCSSLNSRLGRLSGCADHVMDSRFDGRFREVSSESSVKLKAFSLQRKIR